MLGVASQQQLLSTSQEYSDATAEANEESQIIDMLQRNASKGNLLDYLTLFRLIPKKTPLLLLEQYDKYARLLTRLHCDSLQICYNCFDLSLIDFHEVEILLHKMVRDVSCSAELVELAVQVYFLRIRERLDGRESGHLKLEEFLSEGNSGESSSENTVSLPLSATIVGLGISLLILPKFISFVQ